MNYPRYWVVTESSVEVFGGGGYDSALGALVAHRVFNRTPHLLVEQDGKLTDITPPA
jgi:hypothetical protein